MIDSRQLTAEQVEALIQFRGDPGARGLHNDADAADSRVELECYVVTRDVDRAELAA
ncbi:hypothetical protein LCGC14_1085430 [marine sediment metagenome]|uniref:Uncharacterized protein n=1 Tax=marine sediment metagenome TaxID=412755 RepID=A0A0F9PX42_9ZZZZ